MKIQTKLNLSYALVALLLAAVSWLTVASSARTRVAFDEIAGETLPALGALQDLRAAGLRIVASTNEYALIADEQPPAAAGAEPHRDARGQEAHLLAVATESYRRALYRLTMLQARVPEHRQRALEIGAAGRALLAASTELVQLKRAGQHGAPVLGAKEQFEAAEERYLALVGAALGAEQERFERHELQAEEVIDSARTRILALGLLTLAAVVGAGLFITRLIAASVVELQRVVATIDVTHVNAEAEQQLLAAAERAPRHLRDEVSDLALAFARLLQRLRAANERIAGHHDELEQEVAQRTADLRLARARAEELAERAMAADKAKSQFLANMSHEIRTPMNGVLGMTELLLATGLDEHQRRMAQTIESSGELLLGIINDVLDFSKSQAGRIELDHAPFDLRRVVEESLELLAPRAHARGVEVFCDLPADLPTAYCGDPLRLRQILINLIGNAVKFTDRGHVLVRVRQTGDDGSCNQLRFEVHDTGVGIAHENQQRVFELFFQEDPSARRRAGGTGLGLAIVKQLVTLMRGQVGVHSEPGQGSVFWFTACLERAESTDVSLQVRLLDGAHVLVVDDNATNREILRHQLESWGVRVGEAADGRGALRALETQDPAAPYELALLDWHMPGMDGIELAQEIRARPAWSGLRLVMLSSAASGSEAQEARALFDAQLSKPVRQSQLYTCVASALGRAGSPAPPRGVASPTAVIRRPPEGTRVLLAEDNEVNIAVAEGMLAHLGYGVQVARDGIEACEVFQRGRYAAVLMDCQMPRMDGFEATRAMRRWEGAQGWAATPIIALTANAAPGDRERCLAAGMTDFLSKPLTREQLGLVLARHLSGDHQVEASRAVTATAANAANEARPDAVPPAEVPAPTAAVAASPVDWSVLDALPQMERPGQPTLRERLVTLYLQSSRPLVGELQAAVERADAAAIAAAAHPLKSSSGNVGARALAAHCGSLEHEARQGRLQRARELLTRIESEYLRVAAELAADRERAQAERRQAV